MFKLAQTCSAWIIAFIIQSKNKTWDVFVRTYHHGLDFARIRFDLAAAGALKGFQLFGDCNVQ